MKLLRVKFLCLFLFCTLGAQEQLKDAHTLAFLNNELGMKIYASLDKEHQNFVFSPYSLATGLQMLYAGSEEITQAQMTRVLQYSFSPEELPKVAEALATMLTTKGPLSFDEINFFVANSLWVQTRQSILPEFQTTVTTFYKSSIKSVDFQTRADVVRKEINSWVENRTQNKIQDLLRPGDVHSTTRLLLINAMYMQGRWQRLFDPNHTKQTPFFPFPSKTLTVPMMTLTANLPYVKEKKFAAVQLDYATKREFPQLAMLILLPEETYGLEDLEKSLTAQQLEDLFAHMQTTHLVLSLPKFKVISTIGFKEALKKIGLTEPFAPTADFSAIDGSYDLVVSDALQKAFISIDEKGTEAGVATSISIDVKSLPTNSPNLFIANHPFLFFIVEKSTGSILFMGRIIDPS